MRGLPIGILAGCMAALLGGPASAAGDAAAGANVFKKCAVCHVLTPTGKKIGPTLYGVVGRKAGTVEGFAYSEAMKNSGITWDEASLNTYLTDPKKFVPKNKMAFPGLKAEKDRMDVIEYLKSVPK